MKQIGYMVPDVEYGPAPVYITEQDAIAHQRRAARVTHDYEYTSDEAALADFIAVQWAWVEDSDEV